jgi:hypothetical protein
MEASPLCVSHPTCGPIAGERPRPWAGPLDLFGCDRERPFARRDHKGLLWLLNGGKIIEVDRGRVRQSYQRRPVEVGRIVLAWKLKEPEQTTDKNHAVTASLRCPPISSIYAKK